ncbi:hypothetical protein [Piscinibacter sp.]|uniref:hypothetical protein n=1 Tax=Piscinibacter sp. TaxID=1903157 RepID=UPI0039E62ECC
MKTVVIAIVALVALVTAWFAFALNWSYASGERAGWVQKFSKRGWICKTWEGELALVSLPGSSVEKFNFTVHDDALAHEISAAMGKRVSLHYEEKVGLPTSCFGETRFFVNKIVEATDIPLGPGVVLPAQPASAPPAPSSPASIPSAPQ